MEESDSYDDLTSMDNSSLSDEPRIKKKAQKEVSSQPP